MDFHLRAGVDRRHLSPVVSRILRRECVSLGALAGTILWLAEVDRLAAQSLFVSGLVAVTSRLSIENRLWVGAAVCLGLDHVESTSLATLALSVFHIRMDLSVGPERPAKIDVAMARNQHLFLFSTEQV